MPRGSGKIRVYFVGGTGPEKAGRIVLNQGDTLESYETQSEAGTVGVVPGQEQAAVNRYMEQPAVYHAMVDELDGF